MTREAAEEGDSSDRGRSGRIGGEDGGDDEARGKRGVEISSGRIWERWRIVRQDASAAAEGVTEGLPASMTSAGSGQRRSGSSGWVDSSGSDQRVQGGSSSFLLCCTVEA